MNFTHVAPYGNASDYPFYYGVTADLGQTVFSNATVFGLMVSFKPRKAFFFRFFLSSKPCSLCMCVMSPMAMPKPPLCMQLVRSLANV